jgi:hypothetical protein
MNKEETKFNTTEKKPIPERVQIKINEYLESKNKTKNNEDVKSDNKN